MEGRPPVEGGAVDVDAVRLDERANLSEVSLACSQRRGCEDRSSLQPPFQTSWFAGGDHQTDRVGRAGHLHADLGAQPLRDPRVPVAESVVQARASPPVEPVRACAGEDELAGERCVPMVPSLVAVEIEYQGGAAGDAACPSEHATCSAVRRS